LQFNAIEHTLPVFRRLRQPSDFEQVFRGDRLGNKCFFIYVVKNDKGYARLGMVISKKTMPTAVSRNFTKRLVRDIFRRIFPAESSLDIVVRAKMRINTDNAADGRLALINLFQAVKP
jgi:ribonuclease P protein component